MIDLLQNAAIVMLSLAGIANTRRINACNRSESHRCGLIGGSSFSVPKTGSQIRR